MTASEPQFRPPPPAPFEPYSGSPRHDPEREISAARRSYLLMALVLADLGHSPGKQRCIVCWAEPCPLWAEWRAGVEVAIR